MENKKSKTSQDGKTYVEDWLPIKNISNGMIQNDDGEFITGVKISPKNIFILEEGRRFSILNALGNFYNTIDYEFWLLIADRPVDIGIYLAKLQIQYNQTPNPALKKLVMQDIEKANMFMSQQYNVVDTEYFLLFKEKKLELVQKKLHNIISGLAGAGLQANQTSNADLRMILDNYFNDGDQVNFKAVV